MKIQLERSYRMNHFINFALKMWHEFCRCNNNNNNKIAAK